MAMGSAPAPGAAGRALAVGFWREMDAPVSVCAAFGARARRTTAGAAVLPRKSTASFRLSFFRGE